MTGEGQRKTVIGRVEDIASGLQQVRSLRCLALGDFDQRELERDLRLVGVDRQRILVGGFGRSEPPGGEIGAAEEGADRGVLGRLVDGALGKIDAAG